MHGTYGQRKALLGGHAPRNAQVNPGGCAARPAQGRIGLCGKRVHCQSVMISNNSKSFREDEAVGGWGRKTRGGGGGKQEVRSEGGGASTPPVCVCLCVCMCVSLSLYFPLAAPVGRSVSQSVGQSVSQSVSRSVGRSVGRSVSPPHRQSSSPQPDCRQPPVVPRRQLFGRFHPATEVPSSTLLRV